MATVKPVKKARGPGRPFAKGNSGNWEGRPVVPPTLREWCAMSYPDALRAITECLADPDGRVRLKAADMVVARAVQAGVVQSLPPAPEAQEERLRAAEEQLLRLGLAGETAALRAYLAANDARYKPATEGSAGEGSVDALSFVPVVSTTVAK